MTTLPTFVRMHLAEFLIVFLFGIAFTSAPVSGNSLVRGRLDASVDVNTRRGLVELTLDGGVNWYKLCYEDSFESEYFKIASVVCKQLGHGPPVRAEYLSSYDFDNEYLLYKSDWCNVDYTEVSNCSLNGSTFTVPDRCLDGTVYVECLSPEAEEYDVALVRSNPASAHGDGLVLIYVNGQWGPICFGSAADVVCEELGYGPISEYPFGEDPSSLTYAAPVLRYLYCDSFDKTIEECSLQHGLTGSCVPPLYVTVNCMPYTYVEEDPEPERGGFSPSYLSFMVGVFVVMFVIFRVSAVRRARARQGGQNSVGRRGVPSVSSNVNRSHSAPSRSATTNYPRQQSQPSSLQSSPESGMQEADSAPPYPSVPPYPTPNDPDLPSYEDVVRGQRAT